jgi:hypothetical protein
MKKQQYALFHNRDTKIEYVGKVTDEDEAYFPALGYTSVFVRCEHDYEYCMKFLRYITEGEYCASMALDSIKTD